jgi:hypothetical protein
MVDGLGWHVTANVQPFSKDVTDTNAARLYYKRCWLRPYEVRWQAWTLCSAGLRDEMVQVLGRYHRESGPKSDVIALGYIKDWFSDQQMTNLNGLSDLDLQMARAIPEPTLLKVNSLFPFVYASMRSAERARALEQLFWQNPDCSLEERIITGYIAGGDFNSAKRFYRQIRKIIDFDVGFSNNSGQQLWMIGFLQGDEDLMKTVLADCDTGSYIAMLTAYWNCAAHEDYPGMTEQADAIVDRYESDQGPQSTGRLLKGFLPLIPALKDKNDPGHQQALDYFGKAKTGLVLRSILILKYKLSTEDAISFLGGRETDLYRRLLILYLLNDPVQYKEAYLEFNRNTSSDAAWVIAAWFRAKLLNEPDSPAETNLKIPDVKTIKSAVLERLNSQ